MAELLDLTVHVVTPRPAENPFCEVCGELDVNWQLESHGLPPYRRFRLEGCYTTFIISRVVNAIDTDMAFAQTGIMSTLTADGWKVESAPDGETWLLQEIDKDGNVLEEWDYG